MSHAAYKHKNGKKRADTDAEARKPAASKREETAERSASATADDGGQYGNDKAYEGIARDIARLIQKHPVPTIAIGVGLGLIFARLLRS